MARPSDFEKRTGWVGLGEAYDPLSLSHFGSGNGAATGKGAAFGTPTITFPDGALIANLSAREWFSEGDVRKVSKLYCPSLTSELAESRVAVMGARHVCRDK